MIFLQPLALFGLAAAAIPAVLHLMARRVPPTVPFPAVRYIAETERVYSRRLKLRNLLLLLLRMSVIAFLVLAAARPVIRIGVGGSHPPTEVVLIVDNSLSSGAVVSGRKQLDHLVEQAHVVLSEITPDDRLWLALADGVPARVGVAEARLLLDTLSPLPVRMDIGAAVRTAERVMSTGEFDQTEIVLLSDLQRSALSTGPRVTSRIVAFTPPLSPQGSPANHGIDSARAEPEVWSPNGSIVVSVSGSGANPVAVRLLVRGVETSRAVATGGDHVVLSVPLTSAGWSIVEIQLDPDELRIDDRVELPVLVADPAAVTVDRSAGEFVIQAIAVLSDGERVRAGNEVTLGTEPGAGRGRGRSVVFPPADPALVGATNRALRAAGSTWQFGDEIVGEWIASGSIGPAEGSVVLRRRALLGDGPVLATVGSEPWIVRDGDLVLVGSRMEAEWTQLPVTAAFVPFLDLLVNRVARRETWMFVAYPGTEIELPASAQSLLTAAGPLPVSREQATVLPFETGVYYLQGSAGDTVGAVAVTHDPRESDLTRAALSMLRGTLGDIELHDSEQEFSRSLFNSTRSADFTSLLLAAALLAALTELVIAGLIGREVSS